MAVIRRGSPLQNNARRMPFDELPMTSLTPELLGEIKRHLRVNPVRHGEVFRAMERGFDVDQMDTSRGNARNFRDSAEASTPLEHCRTPPSRPPASFTRRVIATLLGCVSFSPASVQSYNDILVTAQRYQSRKS